MCRVLLNSQCCLPSRLSKELDYFPDDKAYDAGNGPNVADFVTDTVQNATAQQLSEWAASINQQLDQLSGPHMPQVLQELTSMLRVQFSTTTQEQQHNARTTALLTPASRAHHAAAILEFLRKRDRLANSVVSPSLQFGQASGGISVEYVCSLPPLCNAMLESADEVAHLATQHDAALVASVVPVHSLSAGSTLEGSATLWDGSHAVVVELGINNDARFVVDDDFTPPRLFHSDAGVPFRVLQHGGGTALPRIAQLQLNFSAIPDKTHRRNGGGATSLFKAIGHVLVDLDNGRVTSSKVAIPSALVRDQAPYGCLHACSQPFVHQPFADGLGVLAVGSVTGPPAASGEAAHLLPPSCNTGHG